MANRVSKEHLKSLRRVKIEEWSETSMMLGMGILPWVGTIAIVSVLVMYFVKVF